MEVSRCNASFKQTTITISHLWDCQKLKCLIILRLDKDVGKKTQPDSEQPGGYRGVLPLLLFRKWKEVTRILRRWGLPPPRHLPSLSQLQELNSLQLSGNWSERKGSKTCSCVQSGFWQYDEQHIGGVEQGELAASPPFREMPAQCVACTRLSQPTRSWRV